MTKRNKIIYWIATLWLALGMVSTGAVQLLRQQAEGALSPPGVYGIVHLGYPIYLLTILGVWKMLGVIAVLIPKSPILKEWAYAGFFFIMSGAIVSHLAVGDPLASLFPSTLLLVLTGVSWYFRTCGTGGGGAPGGGSRRCAGGGGAICRWRRRRHSLRRGSWRRRALRLRRRRWRRWRRALLLLTLHGRLRRWCALLLLALLWRQLLLRWRRALRGARRMRAEVATLALAERLRRRSGGTDGQCHRAGALHGDGIGAAFSRPAAALAATAFGLQLLRRTRTAPETPCVPASTRGLTRKVATGGAARARDECRRNARIDRCAAAAVADRTVDHTRAPERAGAARLRERM